MTIRARGSGDCQHRARTSPSARRFIARCTNCKAREGTGIDAMIADSCRFTFEDILHFFFLRAGKAGTTALCHNPPCSSLTLAHARFLKGLASQSHAHT